MKTTLRRLACTLMLAAFAPLALAQAPFDKPVRILVGFAAGGTADLMARVVADKMKDSLGQPVIVENRPGASGAIAAAAVKGAAPDGTTLMVMPIGPMAVVPHATTKLAYDPLKDFAPVGLAATFDFALALGPASGAKSWPEYVAWAKANPAKSAYATSAAGSLPHFYGVLLGKEAGIEMVHVAYKGSAAYVNDLMGGQVPAAVDTIADLSELHKAGKIRIVATGGTKRSAVLPDVPTFGELGVKGMESGGWFGFFTTAGTPPDKVQALNRALNAALTSKDVADKLKGVGMEPATSTPDEFGKRVAADYAKWGPIVKSTGFTMD